MRGRKPIVVEPNKLYGQLTAIAFSHKNENGYYWTFRCEVCHESKVIRAADVVGGKQKTCGCVNITHGATRGGKCSPAYMSWRGMLARCENPNATGYENYGGRGITVCAPWHDFAVFVADMGERPAGTEIDRRNNDLGYDPGNCAWVTRLVQNQNKRSLVMLTVDGETTFVAEWSRRYGVPSDTIQRRLDLGWSHADAVKVTVGARRGHGRPPEQLTVGTETATYEEWAVRVGISRTALYSRIHYLGWTPERAVTEPVRGTTR